MTKRKLSECGAPPERTGVLWVERLKGDDEQTFVVYANAPYGFFTHYNGSRNVPCWEQHDFCEGGHKEETLRRNYVVHSWSYKRQKQVFAYLTPNACSQCLTQIAPGTTLRGQTIRLIRSKKDNGRLNCRVLEPYSSPMKIPPELDPYFSIMGFLKVPKDLWHLGRSLGTMSLDEIGQPAKVAPSDLSHSRVTEALSARNGALRQRQKD